MKSRVGLRRVSVTPLCSMSSGCSNESVAPGDAADLVEGEVELVGMGGTLGFVVADHVEHFPPPGGRLWCHASGRIRSGGDFCGGGVAEDPFGEPAVTERFEFAVAGASLVFGEVFGEPLDVVGVREERLQGVEVIASDFGEGAIERVTLQLGVVADVHAGDVETGRGNVEFLRPGDEPFGDLERGGCRRFAGSGVDDVFEGGPGDRDQVFF